MKLITKERIGSKTIKHHDSPKTPYQRIMKSPHVAPSVKLKLTKQLENLNPFLLRQSMESKLQEIFDLCYKYHKYKNNSQLSLSPPFGNIYL